MNNMSKPVKFILLPILGIGFVAFIGWVVMSLWNHILPGLIPGVGTLTYIKALGLLLLSRILFGGFKGGGHKPNFRRNKAWQSKMMNMSDEEKEKFKAEWRNRCGR